LDGRGAPGNKQVNSLRDFSAQGLHELRLWLEANMRRPTLPRDPDGTINVGPITGGDGGGGDGGGGGPPLETFVFVQEVHSDNWVVVHNLGRFPSVTVVDETGTVVWGDPEYISENELIIHLGYFRIGTAYLN
jgi:hypothetical protein